MNFFKNIFSLLKHHPESTGMPKAQTAVDPSVSPAAEEASATPNTSEIHTDSTDTVLSESCADESESPAPREDLSDPPLFESGTIHPAAVQIAACIESEFANPALSVRGFAEALQMNPTYLCRIFRASYNMSVSEYINRTRVHHSLEYLENTDMPIEDIAREVGFENTKYFFVLFKNYIGQTPRQYRTGSRIL
ncbi:helix-turn-helix transcriptional regulator [Clostridium sp. AM58-1XD]|uniref:helix-turn-helix transcriptional regulator n=1 Tax=Clostridium sp. AM58-1XD TaxID=2292307 RepID=UPI0015F61BC8|nr:helix-turn-helix transcriptional regulator [Clostridium sp. AM58-1XD]